MDGQTIIIILFSLPVLAFIGFFLYLWFMSHVDLKASDTKDEKANKVFDQMVQWFIYAFMGAAAYLILRNFFTGK